MTIDNQMGQIAGRAQQLTPLKSLIKKWNETACLLRLKLVTLVPVADRTSWLGLADKIE